MTNAPSYTAEDRRALVSVATQFFVNGAVFASFVPRLPQIRDAVGLTVGELGILLSLSGLVGLSGSVASGPLVERLGTRRSLIVGAFALVVCLPILGVASTPFVLLIGLAGLSTFDVVVDVAMNLQGSWLSARRHAPVMNRLHGLWSLGTVVGGLIAAQLANLGVSLRAHLFGVSALLLGVLVFVGRGLLRVDEVPGPEAAGPSPVRRRLGRGPLVALAAAGAFSIVVEITSSDWAAFRLSDDFGAGPGLAGLGYVAFTVGMTLGRFGGDSALLRLGRDRLLTAAIALSAVGLAGASLIPNVGMTLASYLLAGLGISTFFPQLYDDAARYPGKAGAGLGALTAGSRVAGLAAPALVGSLAATALTVGSATAIVTLPMLAGLLVVAAYGRRS